LISVSQQPKPNISLIIITDTPETGPTHQQDHIEQNNTVQGDTGSKTASEECTCMYVKSAKITVAKPYSTAARQLVGHQKARGCFSGVSAFKGAGRDEPGMGNESRTILVFCFFLQVVAELHMVCDGVSETARQMRHGERRESV
jgi:hypothetical protein